MQFRDLQTQYINHKSEIDSAIAKVLSSSTFISGPQVAELESVLSEYVGVKHCITCANGTDALQLALMAWNIGPGDVVFVPDFTFFSSAEVIPTVGATPIFVDIDEDTFNMSPKSLANAIDYVHNNTKLEPKAIIAVDLFGQPADFAAIRAIANANNLLILEDAAQGFGGRIGDQKACSFGDISTTSFFPAKPLGCYGDGGAIFTDNDVWAEMLRSYRVHGKGTDKYDNIRIGMNSRLDTIQAAILLEKIKFFDEEIEKCQQVAAWYDEGLKDCVGVYTPVVKEGFYSSWAQYTVRFEDEPTRDSMMKKLKDNGIPSMVYYRKPMHEQKAFEYTGINPGCPTASKVSKICLSLPMGGYVKKDEFEHVYNCLIE